MQTVICLRWGQRYGLEYVNCLYSMVRRHTRRPLRFVCFTDDPSGYDPAIELKPMPPFTLPEYMRFHPFRRMFIWQETLDDLTGNVLHLDLDMLVTGSIDDFFDFRPEMTFCVAENWTQRGRGIGNMSVFRFRAGSHPYIWERFVADPAAAWKTYRNSQTYVCRNITEMAYWPDGWCVSFKHSLLPPWPLNFFMAAKLPPEARVVAFTGKPDPHEARDGYWPAKWYQKVYKHLRPTPWIGEYWR
jgi:hypothetical protein